MIKLSGVLKRCASAVGLFLLINSAYGGDIGSSQYSLSSSRIKIGYYENEIFQEGAENGASKKGYAYEYYRKLSEYTGWKYEYVYGTFNDLYDSLIEGKIDLLAGLAYKKDRTQLFYYPEDAMGSTSYTLLKKCTSADITSNPVTLNGKKIGILQSAMEEDLRHWISSNKIEAEIKTYRTFDELNSAFEKNEVDAIASEGSGTYGRKDIDVFVTFGKTDYYICVNRKRRDLLDQLNTAQFYLNNDEPEYIGSLNTKYYARSVSSRAFSESELEWINSHSQLKIGYLRDYLPYSDMGNDGNVNGLLKDLVPEMMSRMGLDETISVRYKDYKDFNIMINDLRHDRIDMVFPVGGSIYFLEGYEINQSVPVISSIVGVVYKKNLELDDDKIFAVNKNNKMQEFFVKTNYPSSRIIYFSSIEGCLEAVQSGKADCTTVNGLRVNTILKNTKYSDLTYQFANQTDVRAFGVHIGNEGLLKLVNRGIKSVENQFIMNQVYKYTDGLYTFTVNDFIRRNMFFLVCVFILIIGLVVFFFIMDLRKKKKYLQNETKKNLELELSKQAQEKQMIEIQGLLAELKRSQENEEKYIADLIRYASEEDDADKVLSQLIVYIGTNIDADRAYVFELNSKGNLDNTYEWCNKGISPEIENLKDIPFNGFYEKVFEQFKKKGSIIVSDFNTIEKLPFDVPNVKKEDDIKSIVAVPLYASGKISGMLGVHNPRGKDLDEIANFFVLVEFIFSMMIRIRNKTRDIENNALHDQLTGCKNRKGLKWAYGGNYSSKKSFAVISCDMNGLKQVNDSQGHEAGDNFICRIANTLIEIFGQENVYRIGGDEFIVVLKEIEKEEFDRLLSLCTLQIGTTASVGSVFVDEMNTSFKEILKQADFAMYREKDIFYQDKRRERRE